MGLIIRHFRFHYREINTDEKDLIDARGIELGIPRTFHEDVRGKDLLAHRSIHYPVVKIWRLSGVTVRAYYSSCTGSSEERRGSPQPSREENLEAAFYSMAIDSARAMRRLHQNELSFHGNQRAKLGP